ncbi:MAG: hypothetical protein R3228_10340 [Halioglobus sp.]|nr:hypothetical protein [Halioglobus sp.]
MFRSLLLIVAATALAACKIEIQAPTSGGVATLSGNINCAAGQVCTVDVVDIFFDETFVAQPAAGFTFKNWKRKVGSFCGDALVPCHLTTTVGFAGNAALTAILDDPLQVFFLDPTFQSSGFKALFTGNSFVAPFASGMPSHAAQAGIAGHDHNAVTSGGLTGAPQALWDNSTKGPQIRAILDDGDVDLFAMTALPATLDGYRVWIDYALARNPNTRFAILAPWLPTPATMTTAVYEAETDNFLAVVHASVDTLRAEYPGVEIFCLPYGHAAVELRKLLDAGNLPDVEGLTSGTGDGIFKNDTLGHADPILRDLGRLIWLRAIYDIDLTTYAHDPGYITDLKALAQTVADAHDEAYIAPYR